MSFLLQVRCSRETLSGFDSRGKNLLDTFHFHILYNSLFLPHSFYCTLHNFIIFVLHLCLDWWLMSTLVLCLHDVWYLFENWTFSQKNKTKHWSSWITDVRKLVGVMFSLIKWLNRPFVSVSVENNLIRGPTFLAPEIP